MHRHRRVGVALLLRAEDREAVFVVLAEVFEADLGVGLGVFDRAQERVRQPLQIGAGGRQRRVLLLHVGLEVRGASLHLEQLGVDALPLALGLVDLPVGLDPDLLDADLLLGGGSGAVGGELRDLVVAVEHAPAGFAQLLFQLGGAGREASPLGVHGEGPVAGFLDQAAGGLLRVAELAEELLLEPLALDGGLDEGGRLEVVVLLQVGAAGLLPQQLLALDLQLLVARLDLAAHVFEPPLGLALGALKLALDLAQGRARLLQPAGDLPALGEGGGEAVPHLLQQRLRRLLGGLQPLEVLLGGAGLQPGRLRERAPLGGGLAAGRRQLHVEPVDLVDQQGRALLQLKRVLVAADVARLQGLVVGLELGEARLELVDLLLRAVQRLLLLVQVERLALQFASEFARLLERRVLLLAQVAEGLVLELADLTEGVGEPADRAQQGLDAGVELLDLGGLLAQVLVLVAEHLAQPLVLLVVLPQVRLRAAHAGDEGLTVAASVGGAEVLAEGAHGLGPDVLVGRQPLRRRGGRRDRLGLVQQGLHEGDEPGGVVRLDHPARAVRE